MVFQVMMALFALRGPRMMLAESPLGISGTWTFPGMKSGRTASAVVLRVREDWVRNDSLYHNLLRIGKILLRVEGQDSEAFVVAMH